LGSLCHSSSAVRPAAIATRAARAKPPERPAPVIFCCRVLLSVFDRRHLHRNCSRDQLPAPLGARLRSPFTFLRPCPAGRLAACCSAGIREMGFRRARRLRTHVHRFLDRDRRRHSISDHVCGRVGVCSAARSGCSSGGANVRRGRAASVEPA
jgi:hypothetical protein